MNVRIVIREADIERAERADPLAPINAALSEAARVATAWHFVGGAVDRSGNVVSKPADLEEAELIDALCRRWSCPPSLVLQQDVSALRDLAILALAAPKE